MRLRQAHHE
ncbi:Putative uncharacterized protein [Lacticaseibacillus paracasei]|nr:Putative uncharacterized protein [Lacticaseibacillus paracasei]